MKLTFTAYYKRSLCILKSDKPGRPVINVLEPSDMTRGSKLELTCELDTKGWYYSVSTVLIRILIPFCSNCVKQIFGLTSKCSPDQFSNQTI